MGLLQPGQKIGTAYDVERFLGEGAFAEVYRVRHRFLGRQALKVLKAPGLSLADIERMLSEAVVLSKLGHPNIIRVFNADVTEISDESYGYFTMEYVAGGSLQQFWRSFGARFVPIATVAELTRQICRGLSVAHRENPPIVHRDIKPQNILVGYEADGIRARISDFGLAKSVNPLTLLASARGTRSFKSPEAFLDFQSDSCAGDVWAVGVTMYLLLTDRFPIPIPETDSAIDPKIFDSSVIPASRLNIQVDPHLDHVVNKCLAIDATKRYKTAIELLQDLDSWTPAMVQAVAAGATSGTSKVAMGKASTPDEASARKVVSKAMTLARGSGKLQEAADMLEEAINKCPDLRDEYASQVKLWRRGILM
jgi:serine/threonine-protein kinase